MGRILLLVGLLIGSMSAHAFELFGKGSISKSNLSSDSNVTSVSGTAGFAFSLLPRIRLEFRYSNIGSLQNKIDIVSTTVLGTLTDFKTQTAIYSVGLDIDILGKKSAFQPFIFLGLGYIETERSYYFTLASSTDSHYEVEPKQIGISGNLGAGFRIFVANSIAFEVEATAYGMNVDKPDPLINVYGNVGLRIFL